MAIKSKARQANKLIIQDTIQSTGASRSEILDIINHYTGFTAEVMRAGLYQGIGFPHFGKFVPKIAQIHYKAARKGMPKLEKNIYTGRKVENG